MNKMNTAQAAIGCMLIQRETCDLERTRSARFAGPVRRMGNGTRPSLVIDRGNRETDARIVEGEGTGIFSRLIDAYYVAATKARGQEPFWVFEKSDGSLKAACSISTTISRFTASAGAEMSPTALRERQIQLAKRGCGLSDDALRDLVDASSTDNARLRYQFLDQLDAAQQFSDGGENCGDSKDGRS